MLEHFLQVAHAHQEKHAHSLALSELISKLPLEEISRIAETGEVKLAYLDAPEGSCWLDKFKGTPLLPQALELEEADVRNQTANIQRNTVEDKMRQERYSEGDQIRLQKRLLELELAKQQIATAAADAPAQGAGAPGPVAPEGAQDGAIGKMAAEISKEALSGATMKAYFQKQTNPQGLASASKSLMGRGAQLIAGGDAAAGVRKMNQGNVMAQKMTAMTPKAASVEEDLVHWADGVGRTLARSDLEKEAGIGELLAKHGPKVLDFVRKNPGATIGGGLGALHGLMKGGLGSAVLEGAGGAALGHGGQAMLAHPNVAPHVDPLKAKAREAIASMLSKEAPSPEASVAQGIKMSSAQIQLAREMQKEAFGALLAGAARALPSLFGAATKAAPALAGAATKAAPALGQAASKGGFLSGLGGKLMTHIKDNPIQALSAGGGALSNYMSARQSGAGPLSAAMQGAAGGASVLG